MRGAESVEELYGWIRNVTGYFIFMSVLDNLLPDHKYAKYIRLFGGMVLILLVFQPLTGSLRLEDRIAHFYETLVFRYEADDLKQELLGVEKQRLSQIIEQYEEAVGEDVRQMAEDMELKVYDCQVEISESEGSDAFGTVTSVRLAVAGKTKENGEAAGRTADREANGGTDRELIEIKPVTVEPASGFLNSGVADSGVTDSGVTNPGSRGAGDFENESSEAFLDQSRRQQEETRAAVSKLRRKISAYYDLEEEYVEIQVLEGKR